MCRECIMTRKRKMMLNSVSSIIYQVTALICGFVLPRFFLFFYGSEVNGLVSSITQFLGFISLAECGVGAVVQSALYKPLAEHDWETVSRIVKSSERFYRKVAYLLLGYIAVLMLLYPLITIDDFDYLFTFVLIFVISISTFVQYYLGMTYKLLLTADQLGFIQYTVHTIALILNTVLCITLMQLSASVQLVKLGSSLIFMLQPITLSVVANRIYTLEHEIELTEEPIKQKWNGLAQHIATVVLGNTDTVILTLLSTLDNVSVYAVYHLVVNGVKQIVLSMTNGVQAMFGNMLAKKETEALTQAFNRLEWILHTGVTFVFSVTALLIVPFVQVYTADIVDANYFAPVFGFLITLAQAAYCYRLPYNIIVLAAGHHKQTQWSAILEAVINVVVSGILVARYGLVGVAIGTFAAMAYRTIYLAIYLKNHILHRELRHFTKHLLVDISGAAIVILTVRMLPGFYVMSDIGYLAWVVLASKVVLTGIVLIGVINILLYRKTATQALKRFVKR